MTWQICPAKQVCISLEMAVFCVFFFLQVLKLFIIWESKSE